MTQQHALCECKLCGAMFLSTPDHRPCPVCEVRVRLEAMDKTHYELWERLDERLADTEEHVTKMNQCPECGQNFMPPWVFKVCPACGAHVGRGQEGYPVTIAKTDFDARQKAKEAHKDWDEEEVDRELMPWATDLGLDRKVLHLKRGQKITIAAEHGPVTVTTSVGATVMQVLGKGGAS